MALAYLCARARQEGGETKVADHPMGKPVAIIIDHGLREGSAAEAQKVEAVLQSRRIRTRVLRLRWGGVIDPGVHPKDVPNVETLARRLRYRRIANICRSEKIVTLLTAHHEDDQYETVLMRLLAGHGYRGLQGMRPANDIPESYDIHGAYQSGFIDDQRCRNPIYNMRPSGREKKSMRRELKLELDPALLAKEFEGGAAADAMAMYLDDLEDYDEIANGSRHFPPLAPLEIEDGGVMVYRPLLHFSKDRLIATCVENGIPWFEDLTNADRTLTTRNAVRHLYKNHTLPAALQKPAILRLAERCRARVAAEEAEVNRLLDELSIHSFEPSAGTLVVTPPRFSFPSVPRSASRSRARRQRRIKRYRHVAALLIRRLLSMVTPEHELSQVAQLGHVVSMLFPSLAEDAPPPEPKPYVICGVHFVPLTGDSPVRWLLARAPHVSNLPRPSLSFGSLPVSQRIAKRPSDWKWKGWSSIQLYDGRYWIRLRHRLPCSLRVAPFEVEHQKPFREALDDRTRSELSSRLRRYAPGKIRYTLPAIYATLDVRNILAGRDWWPNWAPPPVDVVEASREGADEDGGMKSKLIDGKRSERLSFRLHWENDLRRRETLQLLALPTLGISLPGLDNWLQWEIRYRKVDHRLLRLSEQQLDRRLGRRELRSHVMSLYRRASEQPRGIPVLRREPR